MYSIDEDAIDFDEDACTKLHGLTSVIVGMYRSRPAANEVILLEDINAQRDAIKLSIFGEMVRRGRACCSGT
jgi:hypothetical protein